MNRFGYASIEARIALWSSRVDAAEAKKAEEASETTLRRPRPPSLIGSEACSHWMLFSEQLTISRFDLISLSSVSSAGWSLHGEHRNR